MEGIMYIFLAISLITLCILIYIFLGLFGIKILSKKVFKGTFDNTKLLLVVTLLVSLSLVLIYAYHGSKIILFPLVINLGVALRTYIEMKKSASK
ncbi:hypothetical protein PNBC_12495 [Paenibacillus crassostreae]|uniref:Uncharacterized protein n=1 Tax=Paenibacillus crassostreae TaxID=1763538 RepID=A0A167DVX0_9BACL|nr:hypothetical protein LPB68_01460 [Paenibacillus crassostreae]OAB74839.1 hypothetical protein PNBC_12495 [Paenibacillus crassostreae]